MKLLFLLLFISCGTVEKSVDNEVEYDKMVERAEAKKKEIRKRYEGRL